MPLFQPLRDKTDKLAAKPDKLFTGAFRQQYGALCFRFCDEGPDVQVLVIKSRDSRRCVIPKGWTIKKKKTHEVAAIEVWEEAGEKG